MCNPTFRIALECGNDYSDIGMTEIWHIADYVRMKRMGLPTPGIKIEKVLTDEDWVCDEETLKSFMEENDIHPIWMEEIED